MSAGTVAMIPARLGSQRLARKNLRDLAGVPLIARAIRRCIRAECFDEIWVNSESGEIAEIAQLEGAKFHKRPDALAGNDATSEDFIREFLDQRECRRVVQVHSIAPLLGASRIAEFVREFEAGGFDTLMCCVNESIECAYRGAPVNFSFKSKTNSQQIDPVQRIPWSITGWTRSVFLEAASGGCAATYAGRIGWFELDRVEGHVIKTERDLQIASALIPLAAADV